MRSIRGLTSFLTSSKGDRPMPLIGPSASIETSAAHGLVSPGTASSLGMPAVLKTGVQQGRPRPLALFSPGFLPHRRQQSGLELSKAAQQDRFGVLVVVVAASGRPKFRFGQQ